MTAEDVIVWALEQRTFDRTPVKQKAAAIMREFGFNGYVVVKREVVGDAWDDGNAAGLDGWVGPGRGTEPDDEGIYQRNRFLRKNGM